MIGGHWDAYGMGEPDATGDRIRHGARGRRDRHRRRARDRACLQAGQASPDRTVVFAAWTAEERGLLGSEYYATHPCLPLETTVANLTMDVLQTAGPARDVVLVGAGQSELDTLLAKHAAQPGPHRSRPTPSPSADSPFAPTISRSQNAACRRCC